MATGNATRILRIRFRVHRYVSKALAGLGLLALLTAITGCAARYSVDAFLPNEEAQSTGTPHTILVASARAEAETSATLYEGDRSDRISYASVTLTVPPGHKSGEIEWPEQFPGDPKRHFTVRNATYLDSKAAFKNGIETELSQRSPEQRNLFVFIHGYNTSFAEATYRLAQLAHDTGYTGVPVLVTWGSSGNTLEYLFDLNSTMIARDGLVETLTTLNETSAREIVLMSHSMGSLLLMEGIRQAHLEGGVKDTRKFTQVIIAAPDIDVDLFKAQMRRIGKPDRPFIILVSRDDVALRLSRKISGGVSRVGAYENDKELSELGAIVVDVTELSARDPARHGRYADAGDFAPLVREMLKDRGIEMAGLQFDSSNDRSRPLEPLIDRGLGIVITSPDR
jgi:esterase/lipase superfamily enzyme